MGYGTTCDIQISGIFIIINSTSSEQSIAEFKEPQNPSLLPRLFDDEIVMVSMQH